MSPLSRADCKSVVIADDAMDRTERIKKLREVLADIEARCGRCSWIGPWGCNERCHLPALKEITRRLLENEGAYIAPDRCPDGLRNDSNGS